MPKLHLYYTCIPANTAGGETPLGVSLPVWPCFGD